MTVVARHGLPYIGRSAKRRRAKLEASWAQAPVVDPNIETVEPAIFDPANENVPTVLAYVADNPDDRERVLAAEQAGKARKSIIDALSPAQ